MEMETVQIDNSAFNFHPAIMIKVQKCWEISLFYDVATCPKERMAGDPFELSHGHFG